MRRTSAALTAAFAFLCVKGASAHRIDEYLQATILSLDTHRVQATMRLIPGILVSPSVIAAIDSDGDGAFSESEERAYAKRVLGDLSITLDGKNVQPTLLSWSFPESAQMREGLGEIHIEYAINHSANSSHGGRISKSDPYESSPEPQVGLPHERAGTGRPQHSSPLAEAE